MLDNNCPRTMMILGAALSGGDAIEMARRLAGQHDAGPRGFCPKCGGNEQCACRDDAKEWRHN